MSAFVLFLFSLIHSLPLNEEILLYPGSAPDVLIHLEEEIAWFPDMYIGGVLTHPTINITDPTIKIFPGEPSLFTGAAVLVLPGGGFHHVALDYEGWEVCEWLSSLGITAILLKYRVPSAEGTSYQAPLQDAQRALGVIRLHAKELNIDPEKIGTIGFSAGAQVSAILATPQQRTYTFYDFADRQPIHLNFNMIIYPGGLDGPDRTLAPYIKISDKVPPTLLVQTEDDGGVDSSIFYYYQLKLAGIKATMHLYEEGTHGYGLRNTNATVNEWPRRAEAWLKQIGIIN